jgi:uncharacterized protein (TIGR02996 family)
MADLRKARLQTWKEVAAFFGKDERTVKRWEAERGLPVHRLPGARSRIYAEVEELEVWLRGGAGAAAAAEPEAEALAADRLEPSQARRPMLRPAVMAAVLAGVLAIAAGVIGLALPRLQPASAPAPASDQPPPLSAQRLYVAGMDDFARRTPESLHRAVDEFEQAVRLAPGYAEAWVGLANCYNLLREFTLMPAGQAYPLARAAARRALALNGRLASAHSALAFVDAYWDWDTSGAEREFQQAIALEPHSDLAYFWYADFLANHGRYSEALAQFAKARALNPSSLAIQADYGLALCEAGRQAEGIAILHATEKADPKFLSPHRYLSGLALLAGRDDEFLREGTIAAQLTDDRQRMAVLDAARAGLARGGHRGALQGMVQEELRQYRYGAVPAYAVANTYALLGNADQAIAFLQLSVDRREENVAEVQGDAAFAQMRGLPRYQTLLARIRPARAS